MSVTSDNLAAPAQENPAGFPPVLRYRLTVADVRAFLKAYRKPSNLGPWVWVTQAGLWLVTFTVVLLLTLWVLSVPGQGGWWVTALIFIASVAAVASSWVIGSIHLKSSVPEGEITLEVGDSGILSSLGNVRTEADWRSIVRAVYSNDYIFLFITKAQAIIIPARVLPSREEFDRLVAYAKERVNA